MYPYILPICLVLVIVIISYKLWRSSASASVASVTASSGAGSSVAASSVASSSVAAVASDAIEKNIVYAINDEGNFDIADVNGKLLNIGFGPNPKVYINLLYEAEKDVDNNNGIFISKVGNSKSYEIGGRPYTVNFTRLISA
jgi:hypothetical protein